MTRIIPAAMLAALLLTACPDDDDGGGGPVGYALDGTSWSYCHVEDNFPQDSWTSFTFIGGTFHWTQIEYGSADSTCNGGAHATPDDAFSATYADTGEKQATLGGGTVTARGLRLSDATGSVDGVMYLDSAPEPDAMYIGFDSPTALWNRPHAREAFTGTTPVTLQGAWRSCLAEMGTDQREVLTVTGYRVDVVGTGFTSGTGACTGTATPLFEDSAVLVLRGSAAATLNGTPVTARQADVVFASGAVKYTILHVDTSASPDVLYTGDESDSLHDASAPDKRPLVLEHWKPRVKQP